MLTLWRNTDALMPAIQKKMSQQPQTPRLSQATLEPTRPVTVVDEYGDPRQMHIAGETPLTLKVDGREIVTLMTLGTDPELLALGYLRNQRLVEALDEIESVTVFWDRDLAAITTRHGRGIIDWEHKLKGRTITSGCGQGTVFSCTLDKLYESRIAGRTIRQSTLYSLLRNVQEHNRIYKQAGAVHSCGLCMDDEILCFVEDVGRHNAADTISGKMWMENIPGDDKLFYTTGRLTSEMVMKAALMGIPILVSRNGCTQMGLELAEDLGITLIARAVGQHFLVYNGHDALEYDAIPRRRRAAVGRGVRDHVSAL